MGDDEKENGWIGPASNNLFSFLQNALDAHQSKPARGFLFGAVSASISDKTSAELIAREFDPSKGQYINPKTSLSSL